MVLCPGYGHPVIVTFDSGLLYTHDKSLFIALGNFHVSPYAMISPPIIPPLVWCYILTSPMYIPIHDMIMDIHRCQNITLYCF